MNSILFLLAGELSEQDKQIIEDSFAGTWIKTEYLDISEWLGNAYFNEGELIVTDSDKVYEYIKDKGSDALIVIRSESDIGKFPGGKYFLMDMTECEPDYYDRIYRRIHKLPWTMYETKHLVVRETVEQDVETFYRIYDDPLIKQFTDPLYENIEDELKYTKEYRDSVYACQGYGIWTLIDRETGRIAGRGGLNHRSGFDEIEVGFLIASEFRNKGYATEAVASFVSFAREQGFNDVNALVIPGNEASKQVLFKNGFNYVKNAVVNGTEYEVYCCKG